MQVYPKKVCLLYSCVYNDMLMKPMNILLCAILQNEISVRKKYPCVQY